MAIVQGIREKVHAPVYDCLTVEAKQQLREAEPSSTLKFFVDVQRKTKLQTNLQSASLLPHYNTFEARALRVVISDLPPEFPEDPKVADEDIDVTGTKPAVIAGTPAPAVEGALVTATFASDGSISAFGFDPPDLTHPKVVAEYEISLQRAMDL